MGKFKKDLLLGKLDLLVLRILTTGESMHGYAIAEKIEQLSENVLQVGEGSLYPALHRMNEEGWIKSEWAPQTITGEPATTKSPPPAAVNWRKKKQTGYARPTPSPES
jgi:DNA-binding PadR family transcriptional regulator